MKLKIYFCALVVAFIVLNGVVLSTSTETSIVRTQAEEYLEQAELAWQKRNLYIHKSNWEAQHYLNLAIYYQNQEIIELLREMK